MAADRLSQLQDAVNFQAENFCNSIGIIQEMAAETRFSEFADKNCSANSGSSLTKESKASNGSQVNGKSVNSELVTNGENTGSAAGGGGGGGEDFNQLFAKLISRTAKDIDILVDSLPPPNETDCSEYYGTAIRRLDQENRDCAAQLEKTIQNGEAMLEKIQAALAEIATLQLMTQNLN